MASRTAYALFLQEESEAFHDLAHLLLEDLATLISAEKTRGGLKPDLLFIYLSILYG